MQVFFLIFLKTSFSQHGPSFLLKSPHILKNVPIIYFYHVSHEYILQITKITNSHMIGDFFFLKSNNKQERQKIDEKAGLKVTWADQKTLIEICIEKV